MPDTLTAVEALAKIQQEDSAVSALRRTISEIKTKQSGGRAKTSLGELRSLVEEADRVEALLDVPKAVLSSKELEAEWPAADLQASRDLLAAADSFEKVLAQGRRELSESSETSPEELKGVIRELEQALLSLRRAQDVARSQDQLVVQGADLDVAAREVNTKPLLAALKDKANDTDDLPPPPLDPLSQTVPQAPRRSVVDSSPLDFNILWRGVHTGDMRVLQNFVDRGGCTGKTVDENGRSAFWHCIAFSHFALAKLLIERFPPGTELGVDVTEIHPRRGDTLLHLICHSQHFQRTAAEVFALVSRAVPPAILLKVNSSGYTFLQIAGMRLNFWVVTFVLQNFFEHAQKLVCMQNHSALGPIAEAFKPAAAHSFTARVIPEHFRVADMLQDSTGAVPYADLAFDVGPETSDGSASGRFLAHRIVVASQSPILAEELQRLKMEDLGVGKTQGVIVRVSKDVSQEVWRSVLQFMYTGQIRITYTDQAELCRQLLQVCIQYELPKQLLLFAQQSLCPLLYHIEPAFAYQVLCSCQAGLAEDLRPVRETASQVILRYTQRFAEPMEAEHACTALLQAVRIAEKAVFQPAAVTSQVPQPQRGYGPQPLSFAQHYTTVPQVAGVR